MNNQFTVMIHSCVICLGSNTDCEVHVTEARMALTAYFPSINWSKKQQTIPIDFHNPIPFLNQVGQFFTELTVEEVRSILKEIELSGGRLPDDKQLGIVRIDIDLLRYDTRILKPDDWERPYIQKGISELLER